MITAFEHLLTFPEDRFREGLSIGCKLEDGGVGSVDVVRAVNTGRIGISYVGKVKPLWPVCLWGHSATAFHDAPEL